MAVSGAINALATFGCKNQKIPKYSSCRTPHGLIVEFEKRHRKGDVVAGPTLFAERVVAKEVDQRGRENSIDLGGSRGQHRALVETGDDRHDEATDQGGEVVKLSHHHDLRGVQKYFFVCLTKSGLNRSLAVILPAARKTHLALVAPQVPGASGEQYLGTVVAIEQRDENGRGTSTFKQSRRRLPVAAPSNASKQRVKRYG